VEAVCGGSGWAGNRSGGFPESGRGILDDPTAHFEAHCPQRAIRQHPKPTWFPRVDCPALGDIAAIVGLAILVAAAAAWLTGNWPRQGFFEIALCVAFALLLWVMWPKINAE
jgi:hypothetical protein